MKHLENEIDIAAFEWLTRREQGLTEDEVRAFEDWIGSDTRHQGAFLRAAAASHQFARHAAQYRVTVGPQPFAAPRYLPRTSRRQALGIALSALCAASAGGWYLADPKRTLGHRYATAVGQVWSGTLIDGSSIVMNTGTELFVNFTSRHRQMHLSRGEVFLNVAPKALKPLLIYAGSCLVRSLGSAFSIRQDERTTVTAVEGSIELFAKDAAGLGQILTDNQQATVTPDGLTRLSERSAAVVSQELAWRNGLLVYSNTPLRVVLADFGRYVTHRYTCRDERTCARRLDGVFDIKQPDAFIATLTKTFDLQAVTSDDGTVLEERVVPGTPLSKN